MYQLFLANLSNRVWVAHPSLVNRVVLYFQIRLAYGFTGLSACERVRTEILLNLYVHRVGLCCCAGLSEMHAVHFWGWYLARRLFCYAYGFPCGHEVLLPRMFVP